MSTAVSAAIAAALRHLGVAATYWPLGGVSFTTTVRRVRASPELGDITARAWTAAVLVQVPAADIVAGAYRDPQAGDVLTFDGEDYTVSGASKPDELGLIWELGLHQQPAGT